MCAGVAFVLGIIGQVAHGRAAKGLDIDGLQWVDANSLSFVGRYLNTSIAPYRRLPADAEAHVRPAIWSLAGQSAGFGVAFETNATGIWVDYNLTGSNFGMFHMAPTGVSGVDLWALDDRSVTGLSGAGIFRWASTAAPGADWGPMTTHVQQPLVTLKPFGGASWRPTRFVLYFPLYNGVNNLSIGVDAEANIRPCGDCGLGLDKRPIVWYGSSITQGACADKPGDAYTNAIGRALRVPVANFGFSGNCLFEPEVMDYLVTIDAQVFVIDCQPNTEAFGYERIYAKARNLVERVRNKTNVPIFIASGTPEGPIWLDSASAEVHANATAALKAVYDDLTAAAMPGLHWANGNDIFQQEDQQQAGSYWEMTVKGTHPNTLGMFHFTKFWIPRLSALIGSAAAGTRSFAV